MVTMVVSSSSCLKSSFFFLASASTCSLNSFSFSSRSNSDADSQRWSFLRLRRVSDHVASDDRTWERHAFLFSKALEHILKVMSKCRKKSGKVSDSPCQTWGLWNAGWPPPSCAALALCQSLWSVLIGLSAPPSPFLSDWPRCEPAAPTHAPCQCPRSAEKNTV